MKDTLRYRLIIVALILILPILTGCQLLGLFTTPNGSSIKFLQSEKVRETSPDVKEAELVELADGNTRFAFDLYQAIKGNEGNLFYSPYSISLALVMTYAGARGETENQIGNTLHFTLPQDRLHPTFNALDLELASREEGAEGQDGGEFHLNIANSIWGQKDYTFLQEFLDVLAVNYGAGLRLLDFEEAPEDSRITINNWVSKQTEGKINDLLPSSSITRFTRLVLTNAIYFNAAWEYPFDEEGTQDGTFNLLDGSQITTPMMNQVAEFNYTQGDAYKVIELPYDGEELSMVILLPEVGQFREFEDSLTTERLNTILGELAPKPVDLTMPKFTYRSQFRLKETLSDLGMPIAFSGAANFSGMDGSSELYLGDVIHQAFISVDEAGTEAAAATAVIVPTSSPGSLVKVRINHPFIFMIRDIATDTILFMGRVVNPAA